MLRDGGLFNALSGPFLFQESYRQGAFIFLLLPCVPSILFRCCKLFHRSAPNVTHLLSFPMGGHVVAFLRQEANGSAVRQHLRDHAPEPHAKALATLAGGIGGEA